MSAKPNFTKDEDEIIHGMFLDGHTDEEITTAINAEFHSGRSRAAILRRRHRLGLCLKDAPIPIPPKSKPVTNEFVEGDCRFKTAMLAAIKSGAEDAIIGVIKDRRPFAPGTYQAPEPDRSLCGSAASMCASA